jgi:hypothetical protein
MPSWCPAPRGGDPGKAWLWLSHTELGPSRAWGVGAQGTEVLVGCGSGRAQEVGDPVGHGSSAGLGPGASQGMEIPIEWSSNSAGLQGGDLVGWLFFYWIVVWRSLPQSKDLECHIFGYLWCFISVKCVSCVSTGFPVQELTGSVALSQFPSLVLRFLITFSFKWILKEKVMILNIRIL